MTENAFPFAAAEEPAEGGSKRKMALLGGVGVLVVALLGYFVVLPAFGGGDDTTALTVVHHKSPKKKATTAAKPAAKKPAAPLQPYNDISARKDPFKALVLMQSGATSGGTSAPASGSGTVSAGQQPSSGSAAPAQSSSTVSGTRVSLLHVYAEGGKQYAQTKVGDKVWTPTVGTVFAGSFKLLATSGKTATYLYGDEQFNLTEGQEVLK